MGMTEDERVESDLLKKVKESRNEAILQYWQDLKKEERRRLLEDISKIDFDKLKEYYQVAQEATKLEDFSDLEPASYVSKELIKTSIGIKEIGMNALKGGKVAFLTVAGGQASRLGYEHPKGCFGISPVTHKSLFQIFAEKMKFYSDYYQRELKWFVMTSQENYEDTKSFFEEHHYFHLKESNVVFFRQGMNPTVTTEGKLILRAKDRLLMNPDGHGGILSALIRQGLVEQMIEEGILYLSYFQVDNPLVCMADPYFIGYHIQEGSEVSTKVIKKSFSKEKLGVVVREKESGKQRVIEYSDMPENEMCLRKENGRLKYEMGSIGIHIFNTHFIREITKHLPIHVARKTAEIPAWKEGDREKKLDVLKFETFVFDTIPLAKNSLFFETTREEEFFPLKNKDGVDSIETCIAGQNALYQSWLMEVGFREINHRNCEISPLFAPDRESFFRRAEQNLNYIKERVYENGKVREEIEIH